MSNVPQRIAITNDPLDLVGRTFLSALSLRVRRCTHLRRASSISPSIQLLFCILFLTAVGCQPLAIGPIDAVGKQSPPLRDEVYLLRGWQDLYSAGIDRLADELRAAGINAHVYRESQWIDLEHAIENSPPHRPMILIGFSFGADDVLRIAERLEKAGIPVDLLITIDPVTPPPVPANVKLCLNYYQSNGFWDIFPWLRGVPVSTSGPAKVINTNIRDDPSLSEPDTSHSTIAANPKLHRRIIDDVLKNLGI